MCSSLLSCKIMVYFFCDVFVNGFSEIIAFCFLHHRRKRTEHVLLNFKRLTVLVKNFHHVSRPRETIHVHTCMYIYLHFTIYRGYETRRRRRVFKLIMDRHDFSRSREPGREYVNIRGGGVEGFFEQRLKDCREVTPKKFSKNKKNMTPKFRKNVLAFFLSSNQFFFQIFVAFPVNCFLVVPNLT